MTKLACWQVLALGAVVSLASGQLHSEETAEDSLDTPFVDGGTIHIELSAGGHRIVESDDDHIRVHWRTRGDKDVEARTDVDGATAKVRVNGPGKNFRTVIEVPRHSNLTVRLTAGELDIEDIVGNKDIRLRAGDLSIEVGDGEEYAHVEGSLWAGDIDARTLDAEASGLFRSIEWNGEGEHELSFHLYAGDVTLH